MKLAVNLSLIFTEVPLIERFQLAKQHGFDHVEIQFPYELSIPEIREQLDQHQLSLCLINVPAGDLMTGGNGLAGIPGEELNYKHALEKAIAYAKALGIPRLNVLAGRQPEDADLLPCLNTLADNLKLTCLMCHDAGIEPVIEVINGIDMPRFLLQNIAQAQEMREAVQSPHLKLQFDCYHMAMMGEDVLEVLQENIDWIGHIQVADYPHRHEPLTGMLPFADLFAWLKQHYKKFVAAEYKPESTSSLSFEWKNKFF